MNEIGVPNAVIVGVQIDDGTAVSYGVLVTGHGT